MVDFPNTKPSPIENVLLALRSLKLVHGTGGYDRDMTGIFGGKDDNLGGLCLVYPIGH